MQLSSDINDINVDNIFCYDKIKNNIMDNSYFYKLVYSDSNCTFNGIFFNFTLKNCYIEKYFDKIKITFLDKNENKKLIEKIKEIEKNIFLKFKTKFSNFNIEKRLSQQFTQSSIKLTCNDCKTFNVNKDINVIVKISGIWKSMSKKDIGLTFRFFLSNKNF